MSEDKSLEPTPQVTIESPGCVHFPVVIEYAPVYGLDEKGEKWPHKWTARVIACAYCEMKFDNKSWVTLR